MQNFHPGINCDGVEPFSSFFPLKAFLRGVTVGGGPIMLESAIKVRH